MSRAILSANVITLNERHCIVRCLQSLRWADQLVVVDGGSSDGTVELARQLADRLIVHQFDQFASQRNRALAASDGEWILTLDADEWASASLAREVRAAIAAADGNLGGFWIPIRTKLFGRYLRHGLVAGERKLRLFRRKAARWIGSVHERPRVVGRIGQLRSPIWHESTGSMAEFRDKLQLYARLQSDGEQDGVAEPWAGVPFWPQLAAGCLFAKLALGRLGILDGPVGLLVCALAAYSVWCTARRRDRPPAQSVLLTRQTLDAGCRG